MRIEVDSAQQRHTSMVVGLGKTGLACARYLHEHGDRLIVVDSRERPPGLSDLRRLLPDTEVRLGGFDEGLLALADRLVVSPGVSLREPFVIAALRRNVEVIGDIELFARAARAPIVGITGSNGKSTVTSLVAAMLRDARRKVLAGGNLGVPALELLRQPQPDFYVLELSSFQLERTHSLRCRAAAVLNLSSDHIDHHGDMDTYAAAKARIFADCDVAIFNRQDALVSAMVGASQVAMSFGLDTPAAGQYGLVRRTGENWLARGARLLMPARDLQLFGRHNIANVLAALAVGEALGLERATTLESARKFRGLPHRTQWVSDHGGITWVNDSKGTNVGAAVAAVESVRSGLVLIAGGDGKGADFAPLAAALAERARAAVLLGADAERLEAALAGVCTVRRVDSMPEAVAAAAALARPGDTVLLSPACSSLDMYANFEARGDAFVAAVRELPQ